MGSEHPFWHCQYGRHEGCRSNERIQRLVDSWWNIRPCDNAVGQGPCQSTYVVQIRTFCKLLLLSPWTRPSTRQNTAKFVFTDYEK